MRAHVVAAAAVALVGFVSARSLAQVGPPLTSDSQVAMTPDQIAKANRADELYRASKFVEALPLFEDLTKQLPTIAVYAERVGVCLINSAGLLQSGPEKDAMVVRAISELKRAKLLGDNSEIVQIMLDRVGNAKLTPSSEVPGSEARTAMEVASVAFAKGDMETALKGYKAASVADPHLYEAPLYEADVYFRQKNYKAAGEWFQKAIDVDPNRETAYRYWADGLTAAGQLEAA